MSETPTPDRAAYMRKLRARNADVAERGQAGSRARHRALTRLAARYPGVMARLLDEERAAEGLPAIGVTPLGRPPRDRADDLT